MTLALEGHFSGRQWGAPGMDVGGLGTPSWRSRRSAGLLGNVRRWRKSRAPCASPGEARQGAAQPRAATSGRPTLDEPVVEARASKNWDGQPPCGWPDCPSVSCLERLFEKPTHGWVTRATIGEAASALDREPDEGGNDDGLRRSGHGQPPTGLYRQAVTAAPTRLAHSAPRKCPLLPACVRQLWRPFLPRGAPGAWSTGSSSPLCASRTPQRRR